MSRSSSRFIIDRSFPFFPGSGAPDAGETNPQFLSISDSVRESGDSCGVFTASGDPVGVFTEVETLMHVPVDDGEEASSSWTSSERCCCFCCEASEPGSSAMAAEGFAGSSTGSSADDIIDDVILGGQMWSGWCFG